MRVSCAHWAQGRRTVEVGGANERDVDTHVTVIGRTVEAEVDAKRHRTPCWVLCAAVEAYLAIP